MDTKAMYKLGYGMYLVGSMKDGKLNGQIANTVFQITSEPPTVAVSINKKNLTHEYISASKVFSASVLCEETPLSFIGRFGFKSGRDTDKLAGISYKIGVTKAPVVLEHAVAFVEAKVVNQLDVGTHTIFIGELVEAEVVSDKACMTYDYYHKVKRGTTPATAATYIKEKEKETVPKEGAASKEMPKYKCLICGYIYDPAKGDLDGGIAPGTPFDKLPAGWVCPVCGAAKDMFEKVA